MSQEAAEYRVPGRPGLSESEVARVCDQMLKRGERPTIEKIRKELGGSPNTITTLLDAWWEKLGERLERGTAAFERIPSHLALHVEGFFLTVLDEARKLASREQESRHDASNKIDEQLSLKGHVLNLREKEMQAIIEQRDHMIALLEQQLTDKRTLTEKVLATRDALERQVRELSITVATLQAKLATTLATPRPRPRPARAARVLRQPVPPKRRATRKPHAHRKKAGKRRGR